MSRIETLRHLVTSKMCQSLKEVDEESLGTFFYNFCTDEPQFSSQSSRSERNFFSDMYAPLST